MSTSIVSVSCADSCNDEYMRSAMILRMPVTGHGLARGHRWRRSLRRGCGSGRPAVGPGVGVDVLARHPPVGTGAFDLVDRDPEPLGGLRRGERHEAVEAGLGTAGRQQRPDRRRGRCGDPDTGGEPRPRRPRR